MSKELQIPLLRELISRGKSEDGDLEISTADDDQIEIPHDPPDHFDISKPEPIDLAELENDDNMEDFSSLQELLIEEEVRMILDKHMENAYEEIIRLIHHHIKH
jgi:hypothetical protein